MIDYLEFGMQVRFKAHDRGVPGGDIHNVHTVDDRGDTASIYGGHCVRQTFQAEKAHPDSAVFPQRRHLPQRRTAMSDVQGRRHAQEPHHRGPRKGTDDQEKGELFSDIVLKKIL